jgi:hypothetical protein
MSKTALAIAFCAVATGCAVAGPYAQLDGQGSARSHADEADVLIVGTDGKFDPSGSMSVTVDPGGHYFLVASTRLDRRGRDSTQTLPLMMKACTRYKLAARHQNALNPRDWELAVTAIEPIPECVAVPQKSVPAPK